MGSYYHDCLSLQSNKKAPSERECAKRYCQRRLFVSESAFLLASIGGAAQSTGIESACGRLTFTTRVVTIVSRVARSEVTGTPGTGQGPQAEEACNAQP